MYGTASHGSNPNLRSAMDTPTRPSSSLGRNPQQVITSLKPHRSFTHDRSNSASSLTKANLHSQPARKPFSQAAPSTWGLQAQMPTEDLANLDLSLERSLGHSEIHTDGSERARRTLEEEIRRGMDQLRAPPGGADESVGFGDLSDAETDKRYGAYDAGQDDRFRARIEDESEDGSTGTEAAREMEQRFNNAPQPTRHQELDVQSRGPQVSSDDEDLSFMSIARTVSPQQNYKPASTAVAAPAPIAPAGHFSSAGLTRATLASFGTAPNENQPPLTSSPALARAAAAQPVAYRPSPLSAHFRPSPSLGTYPNASGLPRGPTGKAPAARAGGVSFATKVNAWEADKQAETEESEREDESRRMRLPDVTGLTEGLQSPVKARGHASVAKSTATTSTEGALLSSALGSMRAKLAQLERENARSDARVHELEAKLARDQANQAHTSPVRPVAASPKQAALESEVHHLRRHVQQLSQNLATQSSTLAALQQPASQAIYATATEVIQLRASLDQLGNEVDGVKAVVEGLLSERDERARAGEWDREERARKEAIERRRREEEVDADRTPRAYEKAARGGVGRDAGLERTWVSAPVENTVYGATPGRSFLAEDEVDRLREMIASPTPRGKRTAQPEPLARPQSGPTHSHPLRHSAPTQAHHHHHYDRASSSTSSASSVSSVSSVAPSVPRGRSVRKHAAPVPAPDQEVDYSTDPTEADTEFDEEEAEVERSFRRARDIFRSVSAPVEGHAEGRRKGSAMCGLCHRPLDNKDEPRSAPAKLARPHDRAADKQRDKRAHRDREAGARESQGVRSRKEAAREDPHIALAKVLGELEADFATHKKLYLELSEQYRRMDSKASGGRRRALAEHLKESIDTLELKAGEVRKLHRLLHPKPSSRRA